MSVPTTRMMRVLLATILLSGCCTPDFQEVPVRVDLCADASHTADLPIGGISRELQRLPGPVAAVLGKYARRHSVGAVAEAVELRGILESRSQWEALGDGTPFAKMSRAPGVAPSTPAIHADALVDVLRREPARTAEIAVVLGLGEELGLQATDTVVPERKARRVAGVLRELAPHWTRWLQSHECSRLDAAKRLAAEYPLIDLLTPALSDIRAWVQPEQCVGVEAQLALGEWIMRVMRGRVHYFAPFDPLAAHRSQQSDRDAYFLAVTDALMLRGYVGVALDSSVGFSPSHNVAAAFTEPSLTPGEWRGIDVQMRRLLEFCVEREIPVLVRAGSASRGRFLERCGPRAWGKALKGLPNGSNLHLAFADFLGRERSWMREVTDLMNSYEGVYAGLRAPVGMSASEFSARLNSVTSTGRARYRVCYASAPFLVGDIKPERCALRDFAAEFGESGIRFVPKGGCFGGHAKSFLFLNSAGAGRDRLERFYTRHGIDRRFVRWR